MSQEAVFVKYSCHPTGIAISVGDIMVGSNKYSMRERVAIVGFSKAEL